MNYYPAYICENGHAISTSSESCYDAHCCTCGAKVISVCSACGTAIRGHKQGMSGYYRVPAYCHGCGNPYPWTETAIQATAAILAEDENITAEECNHLIEILPDVITETPKTNLAAVRIKKALKFLGSFATEGLRQFLLEYGCAYLKQLLGL